MNYYEHHLGDYAEATTHLSILEDGVYSRLIRKYYATEAPLPGCLTQIERLVCAKQTSEKRAVARVVSDFFYLGDDGCYHNRRCDEELERFRLKSQGARNSANARWRSERNANASNGAMRSDSDRNANGMRTHSDRNAKAMLSNLQSPDSISETSPNPLLGGGGGVEGGPGRTRNQRRAYQRAKSADELEREEAERAD